MRTGTRCAVGTSAGHSCIGKAALQAGHKGPYLRREGLAILHAGIDLRRLRNGTGTVTTVFRKQGNQRMPVDQRAGDKLVRNPALGLGISL
ncbi:hypothetical protein IP91_00326 [Pseudoduganella lurida]|uniref:Uncharacterized protein n=1 Tax=Pseudoduganella lurida TaxID=1036180 RepID=A0A562RJM7_9BURK|nr:hypothetical protein IP91_00326 [Pseudoduganella lurida]